MRFAAWLPDGWAGCPAADCACACARTENTQIIDKHTKLQQTIRPIEVMHQPLWRIDRPPRPKPRTIVTSDDYSHRDRIVEVTVFTIMPQQLASTLACARRPLAGVQRTDARWITHHRDNELLFTHSLLNS